MKTAASVTSLVGALVSVQLHGSSAFVAPSSAAPKSSLAAHRQDNTSCDRLTFLKTIATVAVASPLVAFADGGFEDLAMPSADEQKAQDEAAMQERLRKKAELQAQARRPMGYAESMEAERRKQKNLEKSKEERRIALCEELGRGC